MTSNRPANENQLDLICTEEACASTASELPTEESVSAAVEKSALSMTSDPVHRAAANEYPFQNREVRGSVCNGLFVAFCDLILPAAGIWESIELLRFCHTDPDANRLRNLAAVKTTSIIRHLAFQKFP